ncbi:hypothetical protein B5M09_000916 [Aphanomyces astaci]|uniref:Transposase Tc1-like domain-containing protein n=1 Tax=Aphanomyces astaci TaxID=112090 RepID=A0A3R7Z964_APHAT|nr:hypothetical protein B5M09_000916 [Aphanomyces astaci]
MERNRNDDIPTATKVAILLALHDAAVGTSLPHGTFTLVALKFNCSRTSVAQLWKQRSQCNDDPDVFAALETKRRERCGRPRLANENILNAVTNVGLEYRQSVRSVAFHANVSKSTLHRRVQEGVLDFRSTNLKPALTPLHIQSRLAFCLQNVVESVDVTSGYAFRDVQVTNSCMISYMDLS